MTRPPVAEVTVPWIVKVLRTSTTGLTTRLIWGTFPARPSAENVQPQRLANDGQSHGLSEPEANRVSSSDAGTPSVAGDDGVDSAVSSADSGFGPAAASPAESGVRTTNAAATSGEPAQNLGDTPARPSTPLDSAPADNSNPGSPAPTSAGADHPASIDATDKEHPLNPQPQQVHDQPGTSPAAATDQSVTNPAVAAGAGAAGCPRDGSGQVRGTVRRRCAPGVLLVSCAGAPAGGGEPDRGGLAGLADLGTPNVPGSGPGAF